MKSNILLGFLLTTILLTHLQFVVAMATGPYPPGSGGPGSPDGGDYQGGDFVPPMDEDPTGSNNDSNQNTGTTGQNNPTVSVPVPIGAVIASIAGMLLIAYRKIE